MCPGDGYFGKNLLLKSSAKRWEQDLLGKSAFSWSLRCSWVRRQHCTNFSSLEVSTTSQSFLNLFTGNQNKAAFSASLNIHQAGCVCTLNCLAWWDGTTVLTMLMSLHVNNTEGAFSSGLKATLTLRLKSRCTHLLRRRWGLWGTWQHLSECSWWTPSSHCSRQQGWLIFGFVHRWYKYKWRLISYRVKLKNKKTYSEFNFMSLVKKLPDHSTLSCLHV